MEKSTFGAALRQGLPDGDDTDPRSRETAARRPRESVPARLVAHRPRPRRLLDFGCGLARDVEYFRSLGIHAEGYDPYYCPRDLEQMEGVFDAVTCTYVLSALPLAPRIKALDEIRRLLCPGGRLFLSVRDMVEVEKERRPNWVREEDGWRTHRGTFQKGFELREVLELLSDWDFDRPVLLRSHHGITVEAALAPRTQERP